MAAIAARASHGDPTPESSANQHHATHSDEAGKHRRQQGRRERRTKGSIAKLRHCYDASRTNRRRTNDTKQHAKSGAKSAFRHGAR